MRSLVVLVAVAVASPVFAARAPRKKQNPNPPAELLALNTHEEFTLRPDASGHFGKKELRGWSRFLRCHHTGRVHTMSSRLASLLYETAKHFEFKRVFVVAGYRAPRIARKKGNPRSPHKQGVACDFRVEGIANTELRDYLRGAFARVGVGYYPNSDFVHLDVARKVSAFWIDYSGPGERARYSKDPQGDLEAEQLKPNDNDESGDEGEAPATTSAQATATQAPLGAEQPQTPTSPGPPAPNTPALVPSTPRNP